MIPKQISGTSLIVALSAVLAWPVWGMKDCVEGGK